MIFFFLTGEYLFSSQRQRKSTEHTPNRRIPPSFPNLTGRRPKNAHAKSLPNYWHFSINTGFFPGVFGLILVFLSFFLSNAKIFGHFVHFIIRIIHLHFNFRVLLFNR